MQKRPKIGYWSLAGLGRDGGFLCHDRAFWFCVATWFSISRHGSQVAVGYWVATRVFFLATELFPFCFFIATGASAVSQQ